MTLTNIALYRKGPEAETLDWVGTGRRQADFSNFASFHLESNDQWQKCGIFVCHEIGKDEPAKVFLRDVQSGREQEIARVGVNRAAVLYPGQRSKEAGFPRLEIFHGDCAGKPEVIDIARLLIDGEQ